MQKPPDDIESDVYSALQGNPDAFGRLYARYLPEVFRFIRARVRRLDAAEDIAVDVFAKAWQNMDRFDPEKGSFRTWIYTIARRTVIDHYRTRKETRPLDEKMSIAGSADIERRTEVKMQTRRVLEHLASLTDDQREVLELRFLAQLSVGETAIVMDRSKDAVRALQYRALKTLRSLLSRPYEQ